MSFAENMVRNVAEKEARKREGKKWRFSKGKENLHTIYFKTLMEGNQDVLDIGKGEVFFRSKSLQYSEEIWEKGHHSQKLRDKFDYPIISNKRFADDKFHFHLSIILNYQKPEQPSEYEIEVNKFLQNNPNIHIIGIDRGERHLLYVSVINQQGEIVEQFSLNEIVTEHNGKTFRRDYHDLLDNREGNRDKERKDWQTIESIKELKEGYLSHVIYKITQLMMKYNAIVVMEDLNTGFKRGRQKVEKQVYQNFEKMLINKLNYLVLSKDKEQADSAGGVLRAYQLANKFESFKKLGKQSGFVFYVPSAYTSTIDPVTGYVNFINPIVLADSIDKAIKFYGKFKSIRFNPEKQWFEFHMDFKDFADKADGKTDWVVCATNTERYTWNKALNNGKGDYELVNVTQQARLLFNEYNIPYGSGDNICDAIINVRDTDRERTVKRFFGKLNHLLNTTLRLRHNNGKKETEEQDYILSPVAPFFDSRKEKAKGISALPIDADANGAYHIARKGSYLLSEKLNKMTVDKFEKTKQSKDGKSQWLPHKEWLDFVQERFCRK